MERGKEIKREETGILGFGFLVRYSFRMIALRKIDVSLLLVH